MIYQFLGMEANNYNLVCFAIANNVDVIHHWSQVMAIFDWEMPPRFTPAIGLRRNFVYISNLEIRAVKSIGQNF